MYALYAKYNFVTNSLRANVLLYSWLALRY